MIIPIHIPKLGVSMQEGTLVSWLVADGASVCEFAPLYLLETDKVENEIGAPATGTVRLLAAEGETYPVGTLVAEIHDER